MITSTGVESVLPAELDRDQMLELQRALQAGGSCARLVSRTRGTYVIPQSVSDVLARAVRETAARHSITVAPATKQLTTQQAAEVLGVSRPYFIRLLEEGRIPFHKVGTHRRVQLADVVAYQEQQKLERRAAMDKLAELSLDADLEI